MRLAKRTSIWITTTILLGMPALAQTTRALSLGRGGGQANDESGASTDRINGGLDYYTGSAISSDGRYVLFASRASNLVPGDTNGVWDIFRYDRTNGDVARISVDVNGVQGNADSYFPSSSSDNRYVAFSSSSSNLVPNVPYGVFVKDLQTGSVTCASTDVNGVPANAWVFAAMISGNGRYVVFLSGATNLVPVTSNYYGHLFLKDLQTGAVSLVDVSSTGVPSNTTNMYVVPSISADGRYVAFASNATNLVPGDPDAFADAFVRDTQAGTTIRVGQDVNTTTIAAGGRYVAYDWYGSIKVHDLQTGTDTVASVDYDGSSIGGCGMAVLSADGRYVEFNGTGSGSLPNTYQIFVRDLQNGWTYYISTDPSGNYWGNGICYPDWASATISADGQHVVFTSNATNLVAGDTNNSYDVFLADLHQPSVVARASVSGNGFVANGPSALPTFSDGAAYMAFSSAAMNIAPGANGWGQTYVRDMTTGALSMASVSSSGTPGDASTYGWCVSADGRYVAFSSDADNLSPLDHTGSRDVFFRDLQAGTTTLVSVGWDGSQAFDGSDGVSMSSDGRYVAFHCNDPFVADDTNGVSDVFVRDMQAGTIVRASLGASGVQGNGASGNASMSADGRYVAFLSQATNLVPGDTNGVLDVFVRDLQAGTTTLVSAGIGGVPADGASDSASISPDGRYVAFHSAATNLAYGDTNGIDDVFVRDLVTGVTTRESLASSGTQGNASSYSPSISRGGRFVVFVSDATNLVPGDTNGVADVFVHDRLTGQTTRESVSSTGAQGDQASAFYHYFGPPAISADGRLVVFDSLATTLVDSDTNGVSDVFLRDRGNEAIFAPFCFGDGTNFACPCGNSGLPGRGCQNSAGTGGAMLSGSGVPSLAADTVHLISSYELPSVTSILLQGSAISAPTIFGDGRRCAGGTLKRLFSHAAVGGVATAPQGADLSISARSAALGSPISAGSTRIYQMYYRDPSASFCPNPPGNLYNISSAVAVTWTN
jgi:Tol biopolymer transport system component